MHYSSVCDTSVIPCIIQLDVPIVLNNEFDVRQRKEISSQRHCLYTLFIVKDFEKDCLIFLYSNGRDRKVTSLHFCFPSATSQYSSRSKYPHSFTAVKTRQSKCACFHKNQAFSFFGNDSVKNIKKFDLYRGMNYFINRVQDHVDHNQVNLKQVMILLLLLLLFLFKFHGQSHPRILPSMAPHAYDLRVYPLPISPALQIASSPNKTNRQQFCFFHIAQ